jgi:hypothetical protein
VGVAIALLLVAGQLLSSREAQAHEIALGLRWMPEESIGGYAGGVFRVAGTDEDSRTSTYLHALLDGSQRGFGASLLLSRAYRSGDLFLFGTGIGPRLFVETWRFEDRRAFYAGGQVRTHAIGLSFLCDVLVHAEVIGRCGLDVGWN